MRLRMVSTTLAQGALVVVLGGARCAEHTATADLPLDTRPRVNVTTTERVVRLVEPMDRMDGSGM